MTPVPYEPTAGVLDKKLLSLLYRARDGEKGLMPEYDKVFAEYEAAITSGWVDWSEQPFTPK